VRRPALVTMGAVLTELARQYRRADRGEMDWQDAAATARILREIRQTIEGSDLEQRIAALEEAASDDPDWPRSNGAGRYASAN
jgi:hypothetical protein